MSSVIIKIASFAWVLQCASVLSNCRPSANTVATTSFFYSLQWIQTQYHISNQGRANSDSCFGYQDADALAGIAGRQSISASDGKLDTTCRNMYQQLISANKNKIQLLNMNIVLPIIDACASRNVITKKAGISCLAVMSEMGICSLNKAIFIKT